MFLTVTQRRNPQLIEAARDLHGRGEIGPDTYVLDQDSICANAEAVARVAADHQVEPWFVTKQIGRVAPLTQAIGRHIPRATAIDVREARSILRAGIGLGNVGHLVQIPRRQLRSIVAGRPMYVTVFDEANLRAVDDAAGAEGIVQSVIVRIAGDPATTYPGQQGGVPPRQIAAMLETATGLNHVRISGVTGFPCLLFDADAGRVAATETTRRVLESAETLRDAGIDPVIDLPSHSSCSTIPLVASLGGTQVEPGHALTGTTPEHAVREDLPEVPALVYVSEIAQEAPEPVIFGGGFYPRGHAHGVLIGQRPDVRPGELVRTPAENIDYYQQIITSARPRPRLGEVAVMAFRTQMFVQRSRIAVVTGIQSGRPRLSGLFDAAGLELAPGEL